MSVTRNGSEVVRSVAYSASVSTEVVVTWSPPSAVQPPLAQSEPKTASMLPEVSPAIGIPLRVAGSATPLSSTWVRKSSPVQATRRSSALTVMVLAATG